MRKIIGGFIAILLLLAGILWAGKAYFFSIGYSQPLLTNHQGVSYAAKVEGQDFYVLDAQGQWKKTFLAGVNIGLGAPGHFPGEFAIGYGTYFDWFTQIADMGSNVIRVYTPQSPGFYRALYDFNRVAAIPLYLMQGVYMDESDVLRYGDVFAPQSIAIRDMRQDIIDCVNMLHGNAVIAAKAGKASGLYQYDVSNYVIGWILGIECEAALVEGTNQAHPEITEFKGQYVYTQNASPFEVFIAQMKDLVISYETKHYGMQRPVAFSNWITTDPLTHPNEPLPDEDSVTIDVEHIKALPSFTPGFFASYHVYPYYPDFLNFPSGDPSVDENSYLAYLRSIVDYHSMPVLISEFGLPSARGVTHINHLSGLNQGGNSELEQGEGLVSMLEDIHRSGSMGAIVFAWQDEWFKTSWNTMDFDDSDARPKWLNVESSEENFGLLSFSAFPSIQIDGNDGDWSGASQVGESSGIKADWDESYLYLRLDTDDFEGQSYYIPIDTIQGEGSDSYKQASFARGADFILVLDGKDNTRLLIDPYYNANYKVYGKQLFSADELQTYAVKGSSRFIDVQQVICNEMLMPLTGQVVPLQLWNTGKLRYGSSNPSSPTYDSLADFCAGDGFVEIRIPWMLLNFADPSSGNILANLHKDESISFESIQSIYIGLGEEDNQADIAMNPYTLPSWSLISSYAQRLKPSYSALQQAFSQYAIYPINTGEALGDALRLQDIRMLYVRVDREIRKIDVITFSLILSLLVSVYLFVVLIVINIRQNLVFRRKERERIYLLSLLGLPEETMRKKLHFRYLCSAEGASLLCRFLIDDWAWDNDTALMSVLCTGKYYEWMKKTLHSRNMMLRILVIRLTGLLHVHSFEDQIIPLMKAHNDNINLQYAGFLALAMMGNRDSIVALCADATYTKHLSYRSLKEIFNVYTGDKHFLYEKLLNSPDKYIRRIIIKNIGEEGFTEYAQQLIPMLESEDTNLLYDVIRTLGQLSCSQAGGLIAFYLHSDIWKLRSAAVVALAAIDADAYRPQLLAGLTDREWWVRYNSARELCAHVPLESLIEILPSLKDKFAAEILHFAIQEARMMNKEVLPA